MRNFDPPFLVIWELKQACDLACVHCRACAIEKRCPSELPTEEGFRLLDEIRSFGDPLMVFTGGDPLKRPDILPLLQRSVGLGLRTTVTSSATPLLTERAIEGFRECGVARMAISLDGPTPRVTTVSAGWMVLLLARCSPWNTLAKSAFQPRSIPL